MCYCFYRGVYWCHDKSGEVGNGFQLQSTENQSTGIDAEHRISVLGTYVWSIVEVSEVFIRTMYLYQSGIAEVRPC